MDPQEKAKTAKISTKYRSPLFFFITFCHFLPLWCPSLQKISQIWRTVELTYLRTNRWMNRRRDRQQTYRSRVQNYIFLPKSLGSIFLLFSFISTGGLCMVTSLIIVMRWSTVWAAYVCSESSKEGIEHGWLSERDAQNYNWYAQ